MPSDQSCDISDLVFATERNIARITAVSGKFVVPCLNEWRYATKHVALLPAEDRLVRARKMDEMSERIAGFVRVAESSRDSLLSAVARERRKERWSAIGVIATVATALVALAALFWRR